MDVTTARPTHRMPLIITERATTSSLLYSITKPPRCTPTEKRPLCVWHFTERFQPNQVSDAEFEELGLHFNSREIVELVSVISLFGFLNRWSGTMGSELEAVPQKFIATLDLSAHRISK